MTLAPFRPQGLRFEGLVGAPRRNSHAGGLDSPHTAGSASLAAGSSSELTGAPRRPRDAAVNAALDLSRRLTGAGGGSLWQQDPLRGTQHGPAPHLPAHIYQVCAMLGLAVSQWEQSWACSIDPTLGCCA